MSEPGAPSSRSAGAPSSESAAWSMHRPGWGGRATTRSATTRRRSNGCSWTSFLRPMTQCRIASSSTSMPRTIRSMGIRRGGSFMGITTAIAICRCTSSAAGLFWPPSCGGHPLLSNGPQSVLARSVTRCGLVCSQRSETRKAYLRLFVERIEVDCEIASKGYPAWEYMCVIDCAGEFISWVGSRFGATRDPAKFGSFTTRSMRCEPAGVGSTLQTILHIGSNKAPTFRP
jgi:hypothetical protein